jgi:N-acetylglucosaminyldiphosphoundecaprenol N-acetyl-beta-D-mannosaminyltransferase
MPQSIPTVSLFGVRVSKLGMNDSVRVLTEAIEKREPHHVITANPIMIMTALEDPAYMAMMKKAEFIVPDGTGAVWAANYVGEPVAERVPGIELMHNLLAVGEQKGWRAYLLGTSPETIEIAYERLRMEYPRMHFVGYRDGFFSDEQDSEIIADIKAAKPDLLFVARAVNNQEPWIGRYKEELGVPVMMGVGGSFDVIAGKVKRAPKLFQQLRLEWFYRLLLQPTRWRRMLALPQFAIKVIRERDRVKQDIW